MISLFYKEWIKTRWYLLLALLSVTGVTTYSLLRIGRVADLKGMGHLWEVMLARDVIFIDSLQYVPLLMGILLALVQFVPEMQRKCLKLSLHLPYPHFQTVGTMLLFGLLALCGCFAAVYLLLFVCLHGILAPELYRHILLAALPWHLAGIAAYLLVGWICLEPSWKRRIFNLAVSIPLIWVYFLSPVPEAYNGFLSWLALYTLSTGCLAWLSVARFLEGKQD